MTERNTEEDVECGTFCEPHRMPFKKYKLLMFSDLLSFFFFIPGKMMAGTIAHNGATRMLFDGAGKPGNCFHCYKIKHLL